MIEEPTLNTNKSGRSPWGQMCCFTPVILVLRQEDKKYKICLREPVVIYFFMKEEGREERKKRENFLGKDMGGLGFYSGHSSWPWKRVALRPATPPVDYSRLNRNWAQSRARGLLDAPESVAMSLFAVSTHGPQPVSHR